MQESAPPITEPLPNVSREQMRLVLDVARSLAVNSDLDALLTRIARAATAIAWLRAGQRLFA